ALRARPSAGARPPVHRGERGRRAADGLRRRRAPWAAGHRHQIPRPEPPEGARLRGRDRPRRSARGARDRRAGARRGARVGQRARPDHGRRLLVSDELVSKTLLPGSSSPVVAGRSELAKSTEVTREFLAFELGSENYALPLASVREILKPPPVTGVP